MTAVALVFAGGCHPRDPEPRCTAEVGYDGVDNDCDGLVDCDDPDLVDGVHDGTIDHADQLPTLCDGYCTLRIAGDLAFESTSDRRAAQGSCCPFDYSMQPDDLRDTWCVTDIDGSFTIRYNHTLESLRGLDQLSVVDGWFILDGVHRITWLDGLGGLSRVGSFSVARTERLVTLNGLGSDLRMGDFRLWMTAVPTLGGLEGVQSVGSVSLFTNSALVSVAGLTVAEIGGSLEIGDNATLPSLDGLEGLVAINGDLNIFGNPSLADVTALEGLERVTGDVIITDNPLLGNIAANALVDAIGEIGGTVTVTGNHP